MNIPDLIISAMGCVALVLMVTWATALLTDLIHDIYRQWKNH